MRISEERETARGRLAALRGDASTAGTDLGDRTVPAWLWESDEDDNGTDETSVGTRFPLLPERWQGTRVRLHKLGAVALTIVALTAAGVGLFAMWWDSPTIHAVPELPAAVGIPNTETAQMAPSVSEAPSMGVVVSVVGLVHNPGLVTLPAGSRVADALNAVGGVRENADTLTLNLAQKLADGDQVVVGGVGDTQEPKTSSTASGLGSVPSAASSGGGLLNLNTATEIELDALPGVGPVTARAIVGWRTSNGKFTDVEQLGEVDGIGPARLDKLRVLVTV